MTLAERCGPWAVIAGGSEGVGAVFADRLAGARVNLVLVARTAARLETAAAALRAAHGVEVRTLALDLSAAEASDAVIAATAGLAVGMLVCNAGSAGGPVALVDQDPAAALANIRLNVFVQTLLAQHYARGMIARGRGAIVLVGSLGAIAGCKNLTVYGAAKSYTQTFAEGLWAELSPHGIDVAALMIGRTRTPALERTELHENTGVPAAEPETVVDFALANLGEGPVLVPPEHLPSFQAMRAMPRRKAVEIMTRSLEPQTRDLLT
ncbi:SDR family NAD(P)-dependent oxidoreductase [Novosphingobium piscinae]|uniref:SDR family NAD(P)-dependent oxidoreductase n=1 Tax=Novosphingobium piscinae TaxID=1507448 RepID=A0A7X1FVH0_9SPHN|nr:SDR family NAD(P)-dependent oxidoreductase [Novosphingobium piscinae]MBC2667731.1 SDR family NAD(P)-dependent oxidoreductase [Novosphingobium piscinae]